MGQRKKQLKRDKKEGVKHSGKPANRGAKEAHIGPSYVPFPSFPMILSGLNFTPRERTLDERVRDYFRDAIKPGHKLQQAAYRLLGLTYDENGRGYWTRGLARLRDAGIDIPDPPNRFPLPMIESEVQNVASE